MAPEEQKKLEELKSKILDSLNELGTELISDDADMNVLIALSQSTGKIEFLEKAFQKTQESENGSAKAEDMLELLNEVEYRLAEQNIPSEDDSPEDHTNSEEPEDTKEHQE